MTYGEQIHLCMQLGFSNVRLYEDNGETVYFDGCTKDGTKVEIYVCEDEKRLYWRVLHPSKYLMYHIDFTEILPLMQREEKIEQLTLSI